MAKALNRHSHLFKEPPMNNWRKVKDNENSLSFTAVDSGMRSDFKKIELFHQNGKLKISLECSDAATAKDLLKTDGRLNQAFADLGLRKHSGILKNLRVIGDTIETDDSNAIATIVKLVDTKLMFTTNDYKRIEAMIHSAPSNEYKSCSIM